MLKSSVVVPTFDADNPLAGAAGSKGFMIYSNDCYPVFAGAPKGNCGLNHEIN